MVQQGDFSFELVEAETKIPFKEHSKNGILYVEVEPDAEYFLRQRKVGSNGSGSSTGMLLCYYHVDGKCLGYHKYFADRRSSPEPFIAGIFERKDGISSQTALKFTKARVKNENGGGATPGLLMGKVELLIYEGIDVGNHCPGEKEKADRHSSFTVSELAPGMTGPAKGKKDLRSTRGSVTKSKKSSRRRRSHAKGRHLDTILLNYCAAVGLIHVGVLPKPDVYSMYNMKEAYEGKKRPTIKPLTAQPKRIRLGSPDSNQTHTTAEMFDFLDDDSDQE